jgi:hypothetical protein
MYKRDDKGPGRQGKHMKFCVCLLRTKEKSNTIYLSRIYVCHDRLIHGSRINLEYLYLFISIVTSRS